MRTIRKLLGIIVSRIRRTIRFLILRMCRSKYLQGLLIANNPQVAFNILVAVGSEALAVGRNELALDVYRRALQLRPDDLVLRRQLGVTEFLTGLYSEAGATFASASHSEILEKVRWNVGNQPYRVLDKSWLLAIGHVAFLDTYIKSVKLGWLPEKITLLAYDQSSPPAGWPLFKFFSEHIKIIPCPGKPEQVIDKILHGEDVTRDERAMFDHKRAALSHQFWYGPDGEGRTRWFAPLGAAVEAAWKAEKRPALFSLTKDERESFRRHMAQIYGLPEDAWYVLLHVREPGFHSRWHRYHAGTRNADIRTYEQVIDFVLEQGGWVVRGGDPSMTPIAPRERVIDYATNPRRSPEIDVFLCADCTYFVGTNSGFSVIPPVFGKRCALTNWSPIGIPNWYPDDIYIPKLVRKTGKNRYLTFAEMYGSFAGWSQFLRDFEKTDLRIEDNTPEDLREIVEELHAEVCGPPRSVSMEDENRVKRFNMIATSNNGYIGSRMSYRFLEKYRDLLD